MPSALAATSISSSDCATTIGAVKKAANPAGVPTWSQAGILCTGETYKAVVKLTFAKGAALDDPAGLFNSSLDGNVRRAIDIRQDDVIDEQAFAALVRAAIALNAASRTRKKLKPD